MEIVLFACLLVVPVISIVALGLALDCQRKVSATRKMIVSVLANRGADSNSTDALVGYIVDGG